MHCGQNRHASQPSQVLPMPLRPPAPAPHLEAVRGGRLIQLQGAILAGRGQHRAVAAGGERHDGGGLPLDEAGPVQLHQSRLACPRLAGAAISSGSGAPPRHMAARRSARGAPWAAGACSDTGGRLPGAGREAQLMHALRFPCFGEAAAALARLLRHRHNPAAPPIANPSLCQAPWIAPSIAACTRRNPTTQASSPPLFSPRQLKNAGTRAGLPGGCQGRWPDPLLCCGRLPRAQGGRPGRCW